MRSLFLIAAATFASVAWAGDAVVSKDWLIIVPDEEPSGVQRAIESAARELAHDIGEATGLKSKTSLKSSSTRPWEHAPVQSR